MASLCRCLIVPLMAPYNFTHTMSFQAATFSKITLQWWIWSPVLLHLSNLNSFARNAFLHRPPFPHVVIRIASKRHQICGVRIIGEGHSFGLSSGIWVLAWEAEEEDEEDDDEELRRVSTPVLVIFSLRRLASGALSTLFRKKPSRLPLLNAWRRQWQKKNY